MDSRDSEKSKLGSPGTKTKIDKDRLISALFIVLSAALKTVSAQNKFPLNIC